MLTCCCNLVGGCGGSCFVLVIVVGFTCCGCDFDCCYLLFTSGVVWIYRSWIEGCCYLSLRVDGFLDCFGIATRLFGLLFDCWVLLMFTLILSRLIVLGLNILLGLFVNLIWLFGD